MVARRKVQCSRRMAPDSRPGGSGSTLSPLDAANQSILGNGIVNLPHRPSGGELLDSEPHPKEFCLEHLEPCQIGDLGTVH